MRNDVRVLFSSVGLQKFCDWCHICCSIAADANWVHALWSETVLQSESLSMFSIHYYAYSEFELYAVTDWCLLIKYQHTAFVCHHTTVVQLPCLWEILVLSFF